MHYTPTYCSWINQVERWFAYLTQDLLQRSDHRSVQALERDIRNWVTAWNENPRPFMWTKTAEQILESIARLLQRINGAGHSGLAGDRGWPHMAPWNLRDRTDPNTTRSQRIARCGERTRGFVAAGRGDSAASPRGFPMSAAEPGSRARHRQTALAFVARTSRGITARPRSSQSRRCTRPVQGGPLSAAHAELRRCSGRFLCAAPRATGCGASVARACSTPA